MEKRDDGRDLKRSVENRLKANSSQPAETDEQAALFSQDESKELYAKWDAVQVGFVDEPRQAVERADSLVAGAMKRLAEMFAEERRGWKDSGIAVTDVSRKSCAWHCVAIGRSLGGCFPSRWAELTATNKGRNLTHEDSGPWFALAIYSVTVSSVCRLAVESSPAHTSKVLGSTAHAFVCGLQNSQLIFSERELERLRLSGLQRDALESLELAHRPRRRTPALVDVDLRDRIAGDLAGIGDVDLDLGGFAGLHARLAQAADFRT